MNKTNDPRAQAALPSSPRYTTSEARAVAAAAGLAPGRVNAKGWIKITCPDCGSRKAADLNPTTGHYNCFKGHHGPVWKLPAGPAPLPVRLARRRTSTSNTDTTYDLERVDAVLAGLSALPDAIAAVKGWARRRKWPERVVEALAADKEAWRLAPTPAVIASSVKDAEARRYLLEVTKGSWRLMVPQRSAHGEVIAYRRRRPGKASARGPKSLSTPSKLAPWTAGVTSMFGVLAEAVEAAARGERIYIVEGEPDWLAARAVVRLAGLGGVVLGSPGSDTIVKIAHALRDQLVQRKLHARVVVVPDIGDQDAGGLDKAAKACAVLAGLDEQGNQIMAPRAAVALSAPTHLEPGKHGPAGDFGDELSRGGFDAAAALLDVEPVWQMPSLEEGRAQLRQHMKGVAKRVLDGEVVTGTVTATAGAGKTHAALEGLIAPLVGAGLDVVLALPTRAVATEKHGALLELVDNQALLMLGADPNECQMYDVRQAASQQAPGGGGAFCHGCPLASGCSGRASMLTAQRRLSDTADGGRVIVTTHAKLYGGRSADGSRTLPTWAQSADYIICDESPLAHLARWQTATRAQIEACHTGGLVEGLGPVLALIDGAVKPTSVLLAEAAPSGSVIDGFEPQKLDAAAWVTAPDDHAAAVTVPWWLPGALEAACERGWLGCHGDAETLVLADPDALPVGKHGGLFMDATMTPALADALAPDGLRVDVSCRAEPSTVVLAGVGLAGGAGASYVAGNGQDRWRAIHHRFDSPNTLHATHKASKALLGGLAGPVLHFDGTEARGSNAYEHTTAVVLDAYHTPQRVQTATAQVIAGSTEPAENTMADARFIANTAPMVQVAYRTRLAAGGVKVVALTGNRPISGLLADQLVTVTALAHMSGEAVTLERTTNHCFAVPKVQPLTLAQVVWAEIEGVQNMEPVVDGVKAKKSQPSAPFDVCSIKAKRRCGLRLLASKPVVVGLGNLHNAQMAGWLKKWGFDDIARRAGAYRSTIKTSVGKVELLHDRALRRVDVEAYLAEANHTSTWFEWAGQRVQRQRPDAAPTALQKIKASIVRLWQGASKAPAVGAVLADCAVSKDTALRHVKAQTPFKTLKALVLSLRPSMPVEAKPEADRQTACKAVAFAESITSTTALRRLAHAAVKPPMPPESVRPAQSVVELETKPPARPLPTQADIDRPLTSDQLVTLAFNLNPTSAALLEQHTGAHTAAVLARTYGVSASVLYRVCVGEATASEIEEVAQWTPPTMTARVKRVPACRGRPVFLGRYARPNTVLAYALASRWLSRRSIAPSSSQTANQPGKPSMVPPALVLPVMHA